MESDRQSTSQRTWRNSTTFDEKPSFELLPANGTACGCGNPRCRLGPKGDRDWGSHGHLWCFFGRWCHKTVYLDSAGNRVASPARQITRGTAENYGLSKEICSRCGGTRSFRVYASKRLNDAIWVRRCSPRNGEPSIVHDLPTYWWKRNGRLEQLPDAAIERLHGDIERRFPTPKCHVEECQRRGQKMSKVHVVRLTLKDGGTRRVMLYRCRAPFKNHAEFRALPRGEVVTRLGLGRYRWTDDSTENIVETVRGKRPLKSSRVMPTSNCPACDSSLRQVVGPWKVGKGRRRRWRAECENCQKVYRVRNDGEIRERKASKWHKVKGGAPPGLRPETITRCKLAATLSQCGWKQKHMAPYVIGEHVDAEDSIRRFFSKYRNEIDRWKKDLTDDEVSKVLISHNIPTRPPSPKPPK